MSITLLVGEEQDEGVGNGQENGSVVPITGSTRMTPDMAGTNALLGFGSHGMSHPNRCRTRNAEGEHEAQATSVRATWCALAAVAQISRQDTKPAEQPAFAICCRDGPGYGEHFAGEFREGGSDDGRFGGLDPNPQKTGEGDRRNGGGEPCAHKSGKPNAGKPIFSRAVSP